MGGGDETSSVATAMVDEWFGEADTDHDRKITVDELVRWSNEHAF